MKLSILGSTGSIGTQALEVCGHIEEIEVVGLSAHSNIALLEQQARKFKVKQCTVFREDQYKELKGRLKDTGICVSCGMEGLIQTASVPEAEEVETLKWMIDCIQEVTDLPISIDSPSPDVLAQAYKFCKKPGIFNSVSGEGHKIDTIFPIMAEPGNEGWQVIALLSDNTGIPKCAADRLKVFDKIMAKAKEYGIAPDRIHIDPLVEMLCTSEDGIATNIETITSVREQYPTIHITAAISNISFNLPVRKLINYGFLVLAMNAGLDSGIMDPTNKDMLGLVYATEALLGLDDYCMEYIGAYREGLIGTTKKK